MRRRDFAAAFIVEEIKAPEWSSASESGQALHANGLHAEITRYNLSEWAGEDVWEEVFILAFEQLAHEPRWAERLLKVALPMKLSYETELLATRLLLNPHSGLPQKTRSMLRASVHERIADIQRAGARSGRDGLSRVWRDPGERIIWIKAFALLRPTKLNLLDCHLDNLDFLIYFPTLNDLALPFPASGRLDAVAGLNDLVSLKLSHAENPNFKPLASLEKLVNLELINCVMDDLTAPSSVKNLQSVAFVACAIKTMDMCLLSRSVPIRVRLLGCRAECVINNQPLPVAVASLSITDIIGNGRDSHYLTQAQLALAILSETDAEEVVLRGHSRSLNSRWAALLALHTRLKRLTLSQSVRPLLKFVRELPRLRELHIEGAMIESFDALDGLTELEVWADERVKSKVHFRSGRGPKMHYVTAR